MQSLLEQVKLTKSKQISKKPLLQQTREDLEKYNEDPDLLYTDFFAALFDAFDKALKSQEPYHDLNQLFEFISLFVDDGPKNMRDVQELKNIKDEINRKMRQRTQHCEKVPSITAQDSREQTFQEKQARLKVHGFNLQEKGFGSIIQRTPEKGTQQSKLRKSNSLGGSRRRKNKYYKTKRIKHAHKYKKLTKKRRVKKNKTKKYNRHKK